MSDEGQAENQESKETFAVVLLPPQIERWSARLPYTGAGDGHLLDDVPWPSAYANPTIPISWIWTDLVTRWPATHNFRFAEWALYYRFEPDSISCRRRDSRKINLNDSQRSWVSSSLEFSMESVLNERLVLALERISQ